MKTNQSSDTNGTPLSYTADGRKNEIAINDYKNFNLKIGRSNVGYAAIFFSLFHSTFFNCIQTKKGPKLEKIRNNLSRQPEEKQQTVHDATSYNVIFQHSHFKNSFYPLNFLLTSFDPPIRERSFLYFLIFISRQEQGYGLLFFPLTSGSACAPFFFFFFFNNMGAERLERRSAIMATY